jgi:hypothetical protein
MQTAHDFNVKYHLFDVPFVWFGPTRLHSGLWPEHGKQI